MHLLRRKIFFVVMFVLVLASAYLAYNYFYAKNDLSLNYVPSNAVIIIQVPLNNFNLDRVIESNNYWNQFTSIPIINKYSEQVIGFEDYLNDNKKVQKYIKNSRLYVSAFPTKSDDFDLLYILKLNQSVNEGMVDTVLSNALNTNNQILRRNFSGEVISEMKLNSGKEFSYALIDGYIIASFTPVLVDDAITQYQEKISIGFSEEIKLNEGFFTKNFEVKLIYKNLPKILKLFSDKRAGETGINVMEFYNAYSNFKIKIDSNFISGISLKDKTSDHSFVANFNNQSAKNSDLFNILPISTSIVKQVSVNNLPVFLESLKSDRSKLISGFAIDEYVEGLNNKFDIDIKEYLTGWCNGNYAQVILEPVNTNYNEYVYAFFESDDIESAKAKLDELALLTYNGDNIAIEEYKGEELVKINIQNVFPLLYGNIFNRIDGAYFFCYKNFVIVGNSTDALHTMIDELAGNQLLNDVLTSSEKAFIDGKKNHYTLYVNFNNSDNILKSHLNNKWYNKYNQVRKGLSDLNSFIYAYQYHNANPKSQFLFSFSKKKSNLMKVAWKAKFDSELITKPFLAKGKKSKIYKVLVQDENFNLHCLDDSGKKLWNKKLNGKVLSNITELDIRYNGQTQFLFNTNSHVYLIDENGANVLNYPIKLPSNTDYSAIIYENKTTKEIKYFTYCKNKKIYAFNINGRLLTNFQLREKEKSIVRNIQIINSGKPYLVLCSADSTISLYSLNGSLIKEQKHEELMSSYNQFYPDENNYWTSTDAMGNVVSFNLKGVINIAPNPSLTSNHRFKFIDLDNDGSKDYIYMDDGELTAYNTDMIMLLYKKYSENINNSFTVNKLADNSFIGTVSSTSNKIFLVDEDGINHTSFPLNGSSEFELVDLQNTGSSNLVCVSDKNKLLNYKFR